MLLFHKKIIIFICFIFFTNLTFSQDSIYQTGLASYYSDAFQGRYTKNGERYYNNLYTAAHATLPLNTLVKVTNVKNNKSVIVKINDRCVRYRHRIIDLSKIAAKKLDIISSGVGKVTIEIIKPSDLLIIENINNYMLRPEKDSSGNIDRFDIYGLIMRYKHHEQITHPLKTYQSLFLAGYANAFYYNGNKHFIEKMLCTFFPGISLFRFLV